MTAQDGTQADDRTVELRHTAELDGATRRALRALLADAFDGDFSDEDWEHAVGGVHVLVRVDGRIVGHAAVVQRRLLHGGRALRAGYVEGVAVAADQRGRGIGAALMGRAEDVVRAAYDLGALSAAPTAKAFYAARGWRPWRGTTGVLGRHGVTPTPEDDDGLHVLAVAELLDLQGELACDPRPGDAW
ncbi:GNAT family N-acetyltransferase [Patulibacter sp. SYSU D01012]|uniref:GNAT family N-acetyltransferase n=1 Tax=Patulibacter sp. SYSU D01012 TaxID=2817381 RepID=UPI001B315525|nr:GNAT family N-acetyltransferase [Patulibacter sp. SYSU D01012]